jgi:hypothetical protein
MFDGLIKGIIALMVAAFLLGAVAVWAAKLEGEKP